MRTLVALLLTAIALACVAPTASACTNITPPNGFVGVYECGGWWEVRSSGTVASTGQTSGTGWYVAGPGGSPYVAADVICSGGWCYATASVLPVQSVQPRFNAGTLDAVLCVSGTLTGCIGT